jgi:pantoate--beta-alanine ligase
MAKFETVRRVADLRSRLSAWRREGLSIGFVPTMGALHEGHFSLVRRSVETRDRTIVSLFVNPRQFGPTEDFALYPRDEAADSAALARQGAHLLFAPDLIEMYPPGSVTTVTVPGLGDMLEGEFRPGFFEGVATVVTKLLIQVMPDTAFFGEKDYQQLLLIKRLVADLDLPVEIVGCPTVREPDGLALSSRNAYLLPVERARASALYRVLSDTARLIEAGADPASTEADAKRALERAGFYKVDYVAVRDGKTLEPLARGAASGRVLGAAWLGIARLIDNVPVGS